VKTLHANKSDLDERLRVRARKQKEVDTAPLLEPMSRWDSLALDEKHKLAKLMIEVVFISDVAEDGIDIVFNV
jgi:Holliday junction resolvasome RuvABC ATP-dependent DNA helicase subunit